MAAVTGTVRDVTPNLGAKMLMVTAPNTTDNADTIAITLSDFGMSTFLAIIGQTHTTDDSVIITEAPTTSVTTGVLTITVGGSTANKKRTFIIWGT